MNEKPIQLGDRVKDKVSGFTGIVTGITYWLQGCRRIGLAPQEVKDGKILDMVWLDEPQVTIVKRAVVVTENAIAAPPLELVEDGDEYVYGSALAKKKKEPTGGPMPSIPTRNPDPS